MIFRMVLMVCTAGYGAVTDLKTHKIYNKLTVPVMLSGILLNFFLGGVSGLKFSLLGILFGFATVIFWFLGMLKAGDIKLYMALGALGGWEVCLSIIVISILAGGIAAAGVMLVRKTGKRSLRQIKIYVLNLLYTRCYRVYQPEDERGYFSFGCCIFAGTVLSTYLFLY